MLYFTKADRAQNNTALPKAEADFKKFAEELGGKEIHVVCDRQNPAPALSNLTKRDTVLVQFPTYMGLDIETYIFEHIHDHGAKNIVYVWDSLALREEQGLLNNGEIKLFNKADVLIVANIRTKKRLRQYGVTTPIVEQGLHAYIHGGKSPSKGGEDFRQAVYIGNLFKSPFMLTYTQHTLMHIYGQWPQNWKETPDALSDSIIYHGEVNEEDLSFAKFSGFGLVWDGWDVPNMSVEGRYTCYNYPLKLSHYIVSGLPVIVWEESAAAESVKKYGIGLVLDDLRHLDDLLATVTDEQYQKMCATLKPLIPKLQSGAYLKEAIKEALDVPVVRKDKKILSQFKSRGVKMNRWVSHIIQDNYKNATAKPKTDIADIAEAMGYKPLYMRRNTLNAGDNALAARVEGICEGVEAGDLVVYQYPTYIGHRLEKEMVDNLKRRGAFVILFIHDAETVRRPYFFTNNEEIDLFNEVDGLVTPSPAMEERLHELNVGTQMVSHEFFDYLIEPEAAAISTELKKSLVVAGNLGKSPFLSDWHYNIPIDAFGQTAQVQLDERVNYHGAFTPDELLQHIPRDVFGLCWDDDIKEADDNVGQWREYTRYNIPYKICFYIALGLPVIVWEGAQIAEVIKKHHLGLTLSSLDELETMLMRLSDDDLEALKTDVNTFSFLLRDGYFTRNALSLAQATVLGS